MFMIQTNEYGTYLNVTVNDQRKKKKNNRANINNKENDFEQMLFGYFKFSLNLTSY